MLFLTMNTRTRGILSGVALAITLACAIAFNHRSHVSDKKAETVTSQPAKPAQTTVKNDVASTTLTATLDPKFGN